MERITWDSASIFVACYVNRKDYQRAWLCIPEYIVCMSEHTRAAVMRLFSSHYKCVTNQSLVKRYNVFPTDEMYRSNVCTTWKIPSDVILFPFLDSIQPHDIGLVYINAYSMLLHCVCVSVCVREEWWLPLGPNLIKMYVLIETHWM